MEERWQTIPGFPAYDVSDRGRVRSYYRRVKEQADTWEIGDIPQRVLKPGVTKGYPHVGLTRNGLHYTLRIHFLVMLAFVGPRPENLEVCHYNGIRDDNRLANLRYDTTIGNMKDAIRHGTFPKKIVSDDAVIEIRQKRAEGWTTVALAQEYGISQAGVSYLCTGTNRKDLGGPITRGPKKLSDSDATAIRESRSRGATYEDLVQKWSVARTTINFICTGKTHPGAGGPIESFGRQFSDSEIVAIRQSYNANPRSYTELASAWGCDKGTMSDICQGKDYQKAGGPTGPCRHQGRLTWPVVRRIRAEQSRGASYSQLVEKYDVDIGHLSRIINNKVWKE